MTRTIVRMIPAVLLAMTCTAAAAQDLPNSTALLLVEEDLQSPLAEALALELQVVGARVAVADTPVGPTRLARASSAQALARSLGATAGVWLEREPTGGGLSVHVVGVDEDAERRAPLPTDLSDTRTFAVVVASLLNELFEPPAAPVNVRVEVHVDAPGREVHVRSAAAALPAPAPTPIIVEAPLSEPEPGASAPALLEDGPTTMDEDVPVLPREGFTLSFGAVYAGIFLGASGEVGLYLNDRVRVDVGVIGGTVFDSGPVGSGTLRLTVVDDDPDRFDFGALGGLLLVEGDGCSSPIIAGTELCESGRPVELGYYGGGFAGFMWEVSPNAAIGFQLNAALAVVDGQVAPWGFLTAKAELPL